MARPSSILRRFMETKPVEDKRNISRGRLHISIDSEQRKEWIRRASEGTALLEFQPD